MKKRWQMYYSIHSMKNQGFSKRQVAEKLGIDFRTVSKYLAISPEDFNETVLQKERRKNLDLYEGIVTDWLLRHPDMSASQVLDWLKEHYQVSAAERTVRRFVEILRKKHSIPKTKSTPRQYEAIEDPPMGQQMQVDIGMAWVFDAYKRNHTKLYCVAAVLSHSRYKWGLWYPRPLRTTQFIQALEICFETLGGMPNEIVFDQDRLLAVDENYGDIIFTKEFEAFRLSSGFRVYLCRGGDPESKGRIEAVVKYFKKGYAKNRQFVGIDIWNDDFEDWLGRTGNAKVHGTTKKIPAEVFKQERLYLKPVPSTTRSLDPIVTRVVHKDNTIFFDGNRYTVPTGTYSPGRQVAIDIDNDRIVIRDEFGDYIIAEHLLSKNKGELVRNNNHKRDTSKNLDEIQNTLLKRLSVTEEAQLFLTQIRRLKPRYIRDQFLLIAKSLDCQSSIAINKALNYCLTHSLFSAVEFRNAVQYFEGKLETETEQISNNPKIITLKTAAAISKKRALSEYERALKGGEQ